MPRARTLPRRATRAERATWIDLSREPPAETFPRTRAECIDGPRPCPWIRCRQNLYLDVNS